MPTDNQTAEIGRKGVRIIADTVEEMHFIWREMPNPDVGIDGLIELKDGDSPTGQFISVQSKAGSAYIRNGKPQSFDFYSDPNHLVYWKRCVNALILIVYDPEEKAAYWKHIQAYLRKHPEIIEKTPHKITFDRKTDRFTPDSAAVLRALFNRDHSEQEKDLCKHVIAKHSKLTLYSITSSRPLSVELEKVFVTLSAKKRAPSYINPILGRYKDAPVEPVYSRTEWENALEWGEVKWINPKDKLLRPEIAATAGMRGYVLDQIGNVGAESILPLTDALRDENALVIVGEPGAGKTTLLKYLALAFARDKAKDRLALNENRLPILVALRDFNVFINHAFSRSKLDAVGPNVFPTFLTEHFKNVAPHLKFSEDFFSRLLESNRAIVLLDGLDEVADIAERARMAQLVSDIVVSPQWNENRFVVTSRPRGYEGEPRARLSPHCTDCSIRPFDEKDIEQFTLAWYQAVTFDRLGDTLEAASEAKAGAESLIAAIKREPRVRMLAQNPLLLSVLAMVHQRNVELPRLRARLYEECTDFLLGYWDELRDRESKTNLAHLGEMDRDAKRALLEPIALWLHERGERGTEVEGADLEKQLAGHFIKEGCDKKTAQKRAKNFLGVIQDRSGLIVERSPGVFAFAHLTFQEYLAARAIRDREDGIPYTLTRLHDPWWREVVLLHGSLLSDTRGGQNNARRHTTEFITAILDAKSHAEPILRRDLLLTIRCMGDMEDNGIDPSLRQPITEEVLKLWKKTEFEGQRSEVTASFINSANTPQGQRFIKELIAEIAHTTSSQRHAAVAALDILGVTVPRTLVERLIEIIQGGDDEIGHSAAAAIGNLGAAGVPAPTIDKLISLILHPKPTVRECALAALEKLGTIATTSASTEQLLALSHSDKDVVRKCAVIALGNLDTAAFPEVVERLIDLSRRKHQVLQSSAIAALGNLVKAPEARQCLVELMRDSDATVRASVAAALGNQRESVTPETLEWLLDLSRDANDSVRSAAALSLWYMEASAATPSVLEGLLAMTYDHKANVREFAISALGNRGVVTPAMVERLLVLIQDDSRAVQMAAAFAFWEIGAEGATPAAIEKLLTLTHDVVESTRISAASALGNVGSSAATPLVIPRLLELTQSSNPQMRSAAIGSLGNCGTAAATPLVLETLLVLNQDEDEEVRNFAIAALGNLEWSDKLKKSLDWEKFWTDHLESSEWAMTIGEGEPLSDFAYRKLAQIIAQVSRISATSTKIKKRRTKNLRTMKSKAFSSKIN